PPPVTSSNWRQEPTDSEGYCLQSPSWPGLGSRFDHDGWWRRGGGRGRHGRCRGGAAPVRCLAFLADRVLRQPPRACQLSTERGSSSSATASAGAGRVSARLTPFGP